MNDNQDFELAELFAGPLEALVRAEAQAAMATLQFLRDVGFQRQTPPGKEAGSQSPRHSLGELRMVSFDYPKQVGGARSARMNMSVPLLSLVPVPFIRTKESTFEFEVDVTSLKPPPSGGEATPEPLGSTRGAVYRGRIASSARSRGRHPLRVHLKVVPSDLPAGIHHLLNIGSTSTVVRNPEESSSGASLSPQTSQQEHEDQP